jgi:hypothetical protein
MSGIAFRISYIYCHDAFRDRKGVIGSDFDQGGKAIRKRAPDRKIVTRTFALILVSPRPK